MYCTKVPGSGWGWHLSFSGGASGKESTCQRRHGFNSWVGKIPCRGKWQHTPVFLLGKFHEQRSLAGYSPWGPKELDMTEHRHSEKEMHVFFFTTIQVICRGLWPPRRSIVLICTKALWLSSGPREYRSTLPSLQFLNLQNPESQKVFNGFAASLHGSKTWP